MSIRREAGDAAIAQVPHGRGAERADHQNGFFARQQQGIERAAGLFIGVPLGRDAEAADFLDPLENHSPILPHGAGLVV
jgi:hypothetical protein